MTKNSNSKQYDLKDRTLAFAKNVRSFVKKSPKTLSNLEDGKQLVGAGFIPARYTKFSLIYTPAP